MSKRVDESTEVGCEKGKVLGDSLKVCVMAPVSQSPVNRNLKCIP